MIKSMTAFGRAKTASQTKEILIEIKSVNSRFFDCNIKITRGYQFLEDKIKTYLQNNVISRGKIDVVLSYEYKGSEAKTVKIDQEYVKSYLDALKELQKEFNLKDDISVMSVARNQEIFICENTEENPDDVWESILPTLMEASKQFNEMRTNEGKKTELDMLSKLELVKQLKNEVEECSKVSIGTYKEKFENRLRTILDDHALTLDENRILQECAIWADKIAIDEELARLESHFESFVNICNEAVPSGKKLDFLMQELNRETNTIGSKCNNVEISKRVVSMKNELEKIREQVQNVE